MTHDVATTFLNTLGFNLRLLVHELVHRFNFRLFLLVQDTIAVCIQMPVYMFSIGWITGQIFLQADIAIMITVVMSNTEIILRHIQGLISMLCSIMSLL